MSLFLSAIDQFLRIGEQNELQTVDDKRIPITTPINVMQPSAIKSARCPQ